MAGAPVDNQDATLSSDLVELTAVFMTNRIWKGVYATAVKAHRDGKAASVLDAFCTGLGVYRQSLAAQPTHQTNHMGATLNALYKYCKDFLSLDCTYMGFIDICARFILPPDHYRQPSTTNEKKIIVVRTVFLRTVERFIAHILQNAATVVERNSDVKLMTEYKDEFARLYQAERLQFFSKLTAVASGIRTSGEEAGTVSRDLIEKLQGEIRNLLAERAAWQDKCNQLVQYAMAMKALLLEKEQLVAQMEKTQRLQQQVNRRPAANNMPVVLQPVMPQYPAPPQPAPPQPAPPQPAPPAYASTRSETPKQKPHLPSISAAPNLPSVEEDEPDILETATLDELDEELTADM